VNKASKSFLAKLLSVPSPTGFEEKIQRAVKRHVSTFTKKVSTDLHGNLIACCGSDNERRIMLAGHCDQIGFMVTHIDKKGFIYVSRLGGIDPATLFASRVTIYGDKGPVDGVFGRKAIHRQSSEERSRQKLDLSKMWIDIGAKSDKDAMKRVAIGDPCTYRLESFQLSNDLICGPGLDDKVGLFVVMETLRLCSRVKLGVQLCSVSTVQEEVGLRGATTSTYGLQPEVGIAVDVTHSSDSPEVEDKKIVPCELGKGPAIYKGPNVNPVIFRMLVNSAKKHRIPYQILPTSVLLGNDARAMQVSRSGVASASIGIPNRYMHTQAEVCSLKDLENSAKLLAVFAKSITVRTDFRPR